MTDWGDLRRTQPFSDGYGFDRGLPMDRVYIEDFLAEHSDVIRGEVLEVYDSAYTLRFGEPGVVPHVLDIDPTNPRATLVADLAKPHSLAPDLFDCFILTQTLQYVPDIPAALANAWRCLTAGGSLLISVPCSSRIDPSVSNSDRWRFTPAGLRDIVEDSCSDAVALEVCGYGNVLTMAGFLYGLAAEELTQDEIDLNDPAFPLVACAYLRRAG